MALTENARQVDMQSTEELELALRKLLCQLCQNDKDLRRFAMRLAGNHWEADDLLHDSLERAIRFAPKGLSSEFLRAWLIRVMRNSFVDLRRRQRALANATEQLRNEVVEVAEIDLPAPLWDRFDTSDLNLGLARLEPCFRDVLELLLLSHSQMQIARDAETASPNGAFAHFSRKDTTSQATSGRCHPSDASAVSGGLMPRVSVDDGRARQPPTERPVRKRTSMETFVQTCTKSSGTFFPMCVLDV